MTAIFKHYICDRCGCSAVAEYVGSKPEHSGMVISITNNFNIPEGWTRARGHDLCPNCSDKYDSLLNDFFAYKEDGV